MNDRRDLLRASLWSAIAMLIAGIVPMWPYGFYTLLRLVVTGVSIFAIITLGTANSLQTVGLAVVALLFNPLIPVHLPRGMWFPIDLAVAYWFWAIIKNQLAGEASGSARLESGSEIE